MEAERERILRQIYDAANAGNFDALVSRLAPDVQWRAPTRTIHGRNAVAGWLTGWHASYNPHHEIEAILHAGDDVVALVHITYERREENRPAHVWRFEGDQVTRARIEVDRDQTLAELGLARDPERGGG
jgi:ketosteroid isomerase-like protein